MRPAQVEEAILPVCGTIDIGRAAIRQAVGTVRRVKAATTAVVSVIPAVCVLVVVMQLGIRRDGDAACAALVGLRRVSAKRGLCRGCGRIAEAPLF